jgi:hypothetical protein
MCNILKMTCGLQIVLTTTAGTRASVISVTVADSTGKPAAAAPVTAASVTHDDESHETKSIPYSGLKSLSS